MTKTPAQERETQAWLAWSQAQFLCRQAETDWRREHPREEIDRLRARERQLMVELRWWERMNGRKRL